MHGGERKKKKKREMEEIERGGGKKRGPVRFGGTPDFVSCGLSMAPNEEAHL